MSIIKVSDLTFCYEGSYDNIFKNVSFQLDTDWRLGLTGRNGRGKTTLLRLLEGRYPYQGTIHASVGFDYFPYAVEDPSLCPMELLERICPDVASWRFLRELTPLEVSEDALYRPFSTLSGGEQSKLLLAMLFSRENRFLLIDEPTNHLDQLGRALVSRYLRGKKGLPAGVPRPRLSGRLRGSHPVHQPQQHRGAEGEFFLVVREQAAAGRL